MTPTWTDLDEAEWESARDGDLGNAIAHAADEMRTREREEP